MKFHFFALDNDSIVQWSYLHKDRPPFLEFQSTLLDNHRKLHCQGKPGTEPSALPYQERIGMMQSIPWPIGKYYNDINWLYGGLTDIAKARILNSKNVIYLEW